MNTKTHKLREEARQRVRTADRTIDNKLAAALLTYACELEQRARLIEKHKEGDCSDQRGAQWSRLARLNQQLAGHP